MQGKRCVVSGGRVRRQSLLDDSKVFWGRSDDRVDLGSLEGQGGAESNWGSLVCSGRDDDRSRGVCWVTDGHVNTIWMVLEPTQRRRCPTE